MNKYIFIILCATALSSCTEKVHEDFIKDVKFNNQEIKITDFHEDKKPTHLKNTQILRDDQNTIIHIRSETITDIKAALQSIDKKSAEIKMMFAPQQVPYMGLISKDISCTQAVEIDNKFIETEKEISIRFNLTATERLIYGSCLSDQEIYKSQLLMLYCKTSHTLYEIKYFYDKKISYKKQIAHCI